MDLGANVAYKDASGHTVIHLAASNLHTNVIEYFIQLNHRSVPTWRILVGLYLKKTELKFSSERTIWLLVDLINHPDLAIKRATVQCLHTMTTHGEEFWRPLLGTGLIH